jgi:membrane protein EpsK
LSPLLFLLAFHLCVNLAMQPLYALPLAADRVKVPGIVALGIGVGNLLLALLLAGYLGWGLYGLAVPGAVMLTLRHLVFTPLYCARILNKPAGTFYREVIPTVLATAIAIGLCRLVLWQWDISHWPELLAAGAGVSLVFATIIFLLFLKSTERAEVWKMAAQLRPASGT